MHWQIVVDPRVVKRLTRFPKRDQVALMDVLRFLSVNPYEGDLKKMRGTQDVWRRRVGSYRILYEVSQEKRLIHIVDLFRRTSQSY